MLEQFKVKKWGGENAAELEKSPKNVLLDYQNGIKQAVVVSAIRGKEFNTTDKLIELGNTLFSEEIDIRQVTKLLNNLKIFHEEIVNEKLATKKERIIEIIEKSFRELANHINYYISSEEKIIPSKENDYLINTKDGNISLIGFGEYLSAIIQTEIINNLGEEGLKAETLNLEGVLENIDLEKAEDNVFRELSNEISSRVLDIIENKSIAIIPGYIPGFEKGIENTVGRGYSDATAAMTAVGLSKYFKVSLEIQKSVKGMLSADPGLLEGQKAKLIEKIDYLTAKEITGIRGAQAKLLHNQVLRRELQEAGIEIHLFDPFKKTKGTIISSIKDCKSKGVEYIGARDNITFFSVSSGKMSGKGVISSIFSIVKDYTSVDIISTSETEISFTIDSGLSIEKLDEMSQKISKKLGIINDGYENFVKYEPYKALVFCVGQNLSNNMGSLGRAATALSKAGINIEMVSQGIMERAMIFGIQSNKMKEAVNVLHEEFIKH